MFFLTTSSHPALTAKITALNNSYGFAEASEIKQAFKHIIYNSSRPRLKQYYLIPCVCCISSIILAILTCLHSQILKEWLYGKFYIICLGNYCYALTHRIENWADVGWDGSHFNGQDLRFSPRFAKHYRMLRRVDCTYHKLIFVGDTSEPVRETWFKKPADKLLVKKRRYLTRLTEEVMCMSGPFSGYFK
jgi:hypothetical protein